jgi:pimeloyl-ACP methyl ester carboxylesterase
MVALIISIFFLSLAGILVFFLILNFILHRIFYLSPVLNQKTPGDYHLDFKEIILKTKHGKKVQLWDINPVLTTPVIIGIHGWANTADSLLPIASYLSRRRRVVLLNTRNHGTSDKESYMTLVKYKEDLSRAVDYVKRVIGSNVPVILLGHSFGGAAAFYLAANDNRINGVVTISAFADLETVLKSGISRHKIFNGLMNSLLTYIEFRAGEKLKNLATVTNVKEFKGPALICHGTKDEVVPFTDMNKLVRAAERDTIHECIMKGHSHSTLLDDEQLAMAIHHFINRYFPEVKPGS